MNKPIISIPKGRFTVNADDEISRQRREKIRQALLFGYPISDIFPANSCTISFKCELWDWRFSLSFSIQDIQDTCAKRL
jgi:hypothetical protein